MKQTLLFTFLLFSLIGCTQNAPNETSQVKDVSIVEDSITHYLIDTPQISVNPISFQLVDPYADESIERLNARYVSSIKGKTKRLKAHTQQPDSSLYQLMLEIFPYWYGTTWDFNGYTHRPRDGQVACGYFVSTTLRDAGFNLNRYELAKCYSHKIVTTICDSARRYTHLESVIEFIKNRPNDLYIVGLDNHVGFLVKEKSGIYFVHSNYMEPVAVTKEPIEESEALSFSEVYIVGSVIGNSELLQKWQSGEKIPVNR